MGCAVEIFSTVCPSACQTDEDVLRKQEEKLEIREEEKLRKIFLKIQELLNSENNMVLYETDLIEKTSTCETYSLFQLQKDEVKIMERMKFSKCPKKKRNFISRLPSVEEDSPKTKKQMA